jgi:hypothetical protein
VASPVVPHDGVLHRYRPILDVEVSGPAGKKWIKATLDSGSDDTILPLTLAGELGIDLTAAPRGRSAAVGGMCFEYPYAKVGLRIAAADGKEILAWNTLVGFSDARKKAGLLGQSGTLEYFEVTLDYHSKVIAVAPGGAFNGQWLVRHSR